VEFFPAALADYVAQVAESHQVCPAFAALPALAVAAAAMGGAWKLEFRKGFVVPPTLWAGLVGIDGGDKNGALKEIRRPLNRFGIVTRDSTRPEGLLLLRDLAMWATQFGVRDGGQEWLDSWDDAACSVVGGIRPEVLLKCYNPPHHARGLVSRILVACPPRGATRWTDAEVSCESFAAWKAAVQWIRSRTPSGLFTPSGPALTAYKGYFNQVSAEIDADPHGEYRNAFRSKARFVAGRMALIHHGLRSACGVGPLRAEVARDSVEAGIAWSRWCLEEQMRVYGYVRELRRQKMADYIVTARGKLRTTVVTSRQIQHLNTKKFRREYLAREALAALVERGQARWVGGKRRRKVVFTMG